jgi:aspartyl-tRNA(Asn)/glutamyl-tRNA(Gln) amidotransferase subunit A
MTDLADATIAEARALLRSGGVTAVDLLDAVLARAAFTEPHVHAYLTIDRVGALAAAEAADAAFTAGEDRSPLQGIPIALKDNLCTKGVATTALELAAATLEAVVEVEAFGVVEVSHPIQQGL